MEKRIIKGRYLFAGVITLLIFVLGISLGMVMDDKRVKWANEVGKEQELDYKSLQFQYLFLGTLTDTEESCLVLKASLEKSITNLGESLDKVVEFKKNSKINTKEYEYIQRRYLLDNLNYWLLAKRAKGICGLDVVTILYFYSDEECRICPRQGVITTYFKRLFQDRLLVFPMNMDLEQDEDMLNILRKTYNITRYPTLIVDGKRYTGVVEKEELGKIICAGFKNEQPECSEYKEENSSE